MNTLICLYFIIFASEKKKKKPNISTQHIFLHLLDCTAHSNYQHLKTTHLIVKT